MVTYAFVILPILYVPLLSLLFTKGTIYSIQSQGGDHIRRTLIK